MSSYLVVKNSTNTLSYPCKTTHTGNPYLKVDTGYLDLTTETTTGTYVVVKSGESNYRPKKVSSGTTKTTISMVSEDCWIKNETTSTDLYLDLNLTNIYYKDGNNITIQNVLGNGIESSTFNINNMSWYDSTLKKRGFLDVIMTVTQMELSSSTITTNFYGNTNRTWWSARFKTKNTTTAQASIQKYNITVYTSNSQFQQDPITYLRSQSEEPVSTDTYPYYFLLSFASGDRVYHFTSTDNNTVNIMAATSGYYFITSNNYVDAAISSKYSTRSSSLLVPMYIGTYYIEPSFIYKNLIYTNVNSIPNYRLMSYITYTKNYMSSTSDSTYSSYLGNVTYLITTTTTAWLETLK